MTAQYLTLKQAAFGFASGTTFTLDDQDSRYLDIVNSGMVTVVSNPGGYVPTLAPLNPGGPNTTDVELGQRSGITSGGAALVAGKWYAAGASPGTAIPAEATEYAIPLVAAKAGKIDQLAAEVTTVGTGGVVRLGIRADDNGMPGVLLADAGTISGTAVATAAAALATALDVPAGTRLWLTATVQGAAGTRATVRTTAGTHGVTYGADSAAAALGSNVVAYQSTTATTTGALPPVQTWTAVTGGSAPRVAARAA